jgi:hypothetical protein
MPFNRNVILFFFFFLLFLKGSEIFAQQIDKDTINIKGGYMMIMKDSVISPLSDTQVVIPSNTSYKIKKNPYYKSQAFYDSLQAEKNKNQMYSELYGLLIVNKPVAKDTNDNVKAETEYLPFEGMIIREIYIRKVDILAGDVNDTTISAITGIPKVLNNLHISTLEKVIRSNLLIRKGQQINAERMADNEHILRSLNYIEDARIVVIPVDAYSADVIVVTKDVFPIALSFSFSSIEKFDFEFKHKNLFGSGQEIKDLVLINSKYNPIIGNRLDYSISNLFKTFISFNARYLETPYNTTINFRLNRPFVSPETKYAGGTEYLFLRDTRVLTYPIPDTIPDKLKDTSIAFDFSCHIENIWLGRSFLLDAHERKNIIVAGKYYRVQYKNRPYVSPDSNQAFENSSYILGNITYIKKHIVKTRYLLGFGRTEDVNTGYLFSFTTGYYTSDIHNLLYASFRFGYGHAFSKGGYMGCKFEYGSFFKNGNEVLGVTSAEVLLYTPLIKFKQSFIRAGGRILYKDGINRYRYESINLNDDVVGISPAGTKGTSKSAIKFESIYFSNLYLYGFRFAPYVFGTLGLIRSDNPVIYEGDLYSGVGLGLRIHNNSLVFPTFDISFTYYPNNVSGEKGYRVTFDDSEPRLFNNVTVGEPYMVTY